MAAVPPPGPAPVVSGGRTVVVVIELAGLGHSLSRWQDRLAGSAATVRRAADDLAERCAAARSASGAGPPWPSMPDVVEVLRLVAVVTRLTALTRTEAAVTGGRLTALAGAIRLAAQGYATAEELTRRSWAVTDGVVGRLAEFIARGYPARETRIGAPFALPARPPPEGVAGLLALVDAPGAPPGRVDVWQLAPPDGASPGAWAVALPGTSNWAPPWAPDMAPDIRTVGASLDLLAGRTSAEVAALPQALAAAGVPAGATLVLVGHSLGGLTATVAAGEPRLRQRYRVSHVVTAGSPVGGIALPSGVRGLSLEHRADLVPMLDGHPNPAGAGRLTIRFGAERDGPIDDPMARSSAAHALPGYRVAAQWADSADDPALVELRSSLAGVGLIRGGDAVTGRRVILELGATRAEGR